MESNIVCEGEDVAAKLPESVEALICRICQEQNQPRLLYSTRLALATIGEEPSLRILQSIQQTRIYSSFDGFVKHMINKESNSGSTPQKRPTPYSQLTSNSSPFSSPAKTYGLMMTSQGGDTPIATSSTLLLSSSPNVGREEALVALGELEFRKAFIILSYIGSKRLEEVITADEIRSFKNLTMNTFEDKVWNSLSQKFKPSDRQFEPSDRLKTVVSEVGYKDVHMGNCPPLHSLHWDSGKTYEYHCHVSKEGSLRFKGPYLNETKTHLQRVLGDDNILVVKFENTTYGTSSAGSGHFGVYKKIAKQGILVGLRRYQFFVFKDGGREGKKKEKTTSSVKCLFVRFESNASIDEGKDYVLSGKTIKEGRSIFMHVHTLSNGPKYMARFSLILSKTMKLEVDLADVNVEPIEDIPCRDKDGNLVHNRDGEPCIYTDGTGYISEDLALKCPKHVYKGRIVNSDNVGGEVSRHEYVESHIRVPPLLIQFRLFHNGSAVKGTVLVNKKLPPKTIQIRPSMIKVEQDQHLSNVCTMNSFEVVKTSNRAKKTSLSKNLIMLLSYGGVPDDYFMEILRKALQEVHSGFTNIHTAFRVALNHGGLDDFIAANMISSGIPIDESFLQHQLSLMLNEDRKSLLGGKLPISDSYYLMGTVDPSGVLKSDEVCVILDNGQISGKILVYRPPGIHFGDVHVLNARYVEELNEYVGHAKYAIFFPCQGPRSLADEMAGGDFDGDLYFVSRNPQLLDYFKVSEPWVENCSTCEVSLRGPSDFSNEEWESELFELFLRTRFQPSYAMGNASNSWYAIMDRLLTMEDSNSSEKDLMKKNLLKLADIYYEALDASKNGKKIEVPEELIVSVFPHYMEKENSFRSTSIMGKIYDFVKSHGEEVSMKVIEVRKLSCFDVDFREEYRDKWDELYTQYRKEMTEALISTGQVVTDDAFETSNMYQKRKKDEACNAVYDKYKVELYGTVEFVASQRPLHEIHGEALAVYNICYDYAIKINDVRKCGFAWKVAGPALFSLYAKMKGEKLMFCTPSALKELYT